MAGRGRRRLPRCPVRRRGRDPWGRRGDRGRLLMSRPRGRRIAGQESAARGSGSVRGEEGTLAVIQLRALREVASSPNAKVVVPYEAAGLVGAAEVLVDALRGAGPGAAAAAARGNGSATAVPLPA